MFHPAIDQDKREEQALSQSIVLVDGDLSTVDAHESVQKLISSAQDYFGFRNFSHQERFGQKDAWSERMLSNLEGRSQAVISLIDGARVNGKKIRVTAKIAVKVDEN